MILRATRLRLRLGASPGPNVPQCSYNSWGGAFAAPRQAPGGFVRPRQEANGGERGVYTAEKRRSPPLHAAAYPSLQLYRAALSAAVSEQLNLALAETARRLLPRLAAGEPAARLRGAGLPFYPEVELITSSGGGGEGGWQKKKKRRHGDDDGDDDGGDDDAPAAAVKKTFLKIVGAREPASAPPQS